jgi:gliding motility-associated lipoprotein GldD
MIEKSKYILILLFIISGCKQNYSPKPRGYYRIDFPEKNYVHFDTTCPFSFEYPSYGKITKDPFNPEIDCWYNIVFEAYSGKIHLSYKKVDNNLAQLLEDTRTMVYKHTIKADAIEAQEYQGTNNSFGVIYDIKGNAASPVQFFITDSLNHFLRGSFYIETTPNKDSLKPVIDYFRKDIVHLMETTRWK